MNLTVTGARRAGSRRCMRAIRISPDTSSLNYQTGQPIANGVITKVSAQGKVCVYVNRSAHIVLDVFGVFPSDSAFTPVGPDRAIDTRLNGRDPRGAGVDVDDSGGFAVCREVDFGELDGAGRWRVGSRRCMRAIRISPDTSSLNYQASQSIANGVITKVSAQGTVCVYVNQSAHVVLDVFGVFPSDSALTPVGPDRAIDTRLNGGIRVALVSTLTIPVGSQYAGKSISVNLTVPGVGAWVRDVVCVRSGTARYVVAELSGEPVDRERCDHQGQPTGHRVRVPEPVGTRGARRVRRVPNVLGSEFR